MIRVVQWASVAYSLFHLDSVQLAIRIPEVIQLQSGKLVDFWV